MEEKYKLLNLRSKTYKNIEFKIITFKIFSYGRLLNILCFQPKYCEGF